MPIQSSDLEVRYSQPLAEAGDALPQPDPSQSLGGFCATTPWLGGSVHDLFGPLSSADNTDLTSEYRCVFLVNRHTTETWRDVRAWFPDAQTSGGADLALAADIIDATSLDADFPQAAAVASGANAPAGLTFTSPTTRDDGIVLGDIGPSQVRALWLRRTGLDTRSDEPDGATLEFQGTSR